MRALVIDEPGSAQVVERIVGGNRSGRVDRHRCFLRLGGNVQRSAVRQYEAVAGDIDDAAVDAYCPDIGTSNATSRQGRRGTYTPASMRFGNSRTESQRDSGLKPRVARNELPWDIAARPNNPNGVVARP